MALIKKCVIFLLLIQVSRCIRNGTLHVILYDNYIYQKKNDGNQTVLEKTFSYAKKLYCHDLPNIQIHHAVEDHTSIQDIVKSDNPLQLLEEKYNIRNTTNILVGTMSPNGKNLDVVNHFKPYDKFFPSDGVVAIVHRSVLLLPHIILSSINNSGDFFVAMIMLAIPAGLLLWLLERWGSNPNFSNRFVSGAYDTTWWAFVTMTTVGYGDKVPVSVPGRLLGILWMIVSIVFTAIMTSIITGHLSDYSISLSSRPIAALRHSWEHMVAEKTTTDQVHLCSTYVECLNMVANRTSFGTVIDANQAANMQDMINDKNLRITFLIKKPFTSFLYFYSSDENKDDTQYVVDCLDKLTDSSRLMIHNLYVPVIHYTTSEAENPKEFFTESPYVGFIILGVIGGLCLIGMIIDIFAHRNSKKKKDSSYVASNGNAIGMKDLAKPQRLAMKKKIENLKQELLDEIKEMEIDLVNSLSRINAN